MTWRAAVAAMVVVSGSAACSTALPPALPSAPAYPDVPALEVPASLRVTPDVTARHGSAWRRFQSGDLRGAARDYAAALQLAPGFYPAEAGLGWVAFEEGQWEEAARRFDRVLAVAGDYVPALSGRVETALSASDNVAALRTLEAWQAMTAPGAAQEELRGRLDVLRLRAVQGELSRASQARANDRLDEAEAALDRARAMSPESGIVLRELARVQIARGALDAAEQHAEEAVRLDPGDAEAHAVLGEVLEAHGRLREAAAAFARAQAIAPRQEWQARVAAINSRADFNALPAEFRAIPSASSLTRGQLAALLGSRLQDAIDRAPRRVAVVLTDVRGHWAASWILPVTRAGLMEPLPNHTFQPGAPVRRADLAQVIWQAIQVLGAHRPDDIARWRAARPSLPDVPATHLAATAIAAVIDAGAMSAQEDGRFAPARVVTGAEAIAAVARLEQIAGTGGGR